MLHMQILSNFHAYTGKNQVIKDTQFSISFKILLKSLYYLIFIATAFWILKFIPFWYQKV